MEKGVGDGLASESATVAPSTDDAQPEPIPLLRFGLLCLGVCLGLFLAMIDTSIVATSLYIIGIEFNDLDNVNWIALAYTLAYMGCAVVFSRISDIVGRRNAFVAAYVLFFAFSLACGWARNMSQMIAFRAVQGVGGSGLYSLTMIMLPEMSPEHLTQHIGAMVGLVVAVSGVLGPVLGGVLTRYASWRWVFWINGPIGAVSLAIFFLSWPQEKYRPVLIKHSWKELDFPGSLLTIAAAVLVVFAFQNTGASSSSNEGNNWSSPVFIAALIVGLVCWVALFSWEYLVERYFEARIAPVFPIRLFRRGIYAPGAINTLLNGFPYILLIYAVPLRIQVVGGKSPLLAGAMMLPMLVAVAVASALSGAANAKRQIIVETMVVGSCLMLLGCGLLTTLSVEELDTAKLLVFTAFCGFGFGLTVSASTMIAAHEDERDYAPAQGILAQFRIFGGSLGIAASTAMLRTELIGIPTTFSKSDGIQTGMITRMAYARALQKDMVAATAITGLAVVTIFFALWQSRKRGYKLSR